MVQARSRRPKSNPAFFRAGDRAFALELSNGDFRRGAR
jgi:hypothetical protein